MKRDEISDKISIYSWYINQASWRLEKLILNRQLDNYLVYKAKDYQKIVQQIGSVKKHISELKAYLNEVEEKYIYLWEYDPNIQGKRFLEELELKESMLKCIVNAKKEKK